MKKIVIISLGRSTAECAAAQLKKLLEKHIELEIILMSEITYKHIEGDLILFTSEYTLELALKHFTIDIPYIIAKRVINHKNIKEVIAIPKGSEVLLVNDGYGTAREAIEQLNEIGLDHIIYHPFYPGCTSYPQPDIMITPGEMHLVPYIGKQMIDIGSRILDIQTVHEILSVLNMEDLIKESLVTSYIRDIVEISKSIELSRRAVLESERLLDTILNSIENGIAFVSEVGTIASVNSKFESMLGKKKKDLLNKTIYQLILDAEIVLKDNESFVTSIEGREILVEIRQANFEKSLGYLVILNYTDKISKLGSEIRKSYEKRRSRKLYTIEDYLSVNDRVKEMLKKAEKFAKTNATILIQGENGTGKEVLAQAIHTMSYRSKNLFIPVNITAISSSLLESELFGYEGGAFTGAVKGGKMGLFELASGGTIFIDEIGDAPLDFQVKLLRVIEEKRIRRVGALEEIPVDVRIIAATNKNLLKLIDKGRFREDLFFRLNTLPINTIPLRERRDDIRFLLKHFANISFYNKNINNIEDIFEEEAIEALEKYKWRGNVRELINLVEYLSLIYDGEKLDTSSLHYYMLENEREEKRIILDSDQLWILEEINKNGSLGIGRTGLANIAEDKDKSIGEGKIRRIIKELEEKDLIKSCGNKKGSIITENGINTLSYYKQLDKNNHV